MADPAPVDVDHCAHAGHWHCAPTMFTQRIMTAYTFQLHVNKAFTTTLKRLISGRSKKNWNLQDQQIHWGKWNKTKCQFALSDHCFRKRTYTATNISTYLNVYLSCNLTGRDAHSVWHRAVKI